MKKIISFLASCLIICGLFFGFSQGYQLNYGDFLTVYAEGVTMGLEKKGIDIGDGWKDIDVLYTNVNKNSTLYKALQKGIYLGLYLNENNELPINKSLKELEDSDYEFDFDSDFEGDFDDILNDEDLKSLSVYNDLVKLINSLDKLMNTEYDIYGDNLSWLQDLIDVTVDAYTIIFNFMDEIMKEITDNIEQDLDLSDSSTDNAILRLKYDSLYSEKLKGNEEKCTTITGCIELIDDEYTQYYNEDETKTLLEDLEGKFFGIGAYIEDKGNYFEIIGTTPKSPAESAGLQAGDILIQIDNHIINSQTTLQDVSSRIKGEKGSYTTITIKRQNEIIKKTLKKDEIILPNVSFETFGSNICYMDIKQFNSDTLYQYLSGINYFQTKQCNVFLFDLRDNLGGDLNIVVEMLNNFVNSGDTIVQMDYGNFTQDIVADNESPKLNNKTMIIFANGNTASASEIFIGVTKDYVKQNVLVGSQTYGKGTAQSVVFYDDGTALKYTSAKRNTGKSKKNIDKVGFTPDVKLGDPDINKLIELLREKK